MHRSRLLLQKAAKSVTAEAPKATKDAAKAAAVSAPHDHDNSPPPTSSCPPYIPLYHHKDPSLFPYKERNPGTFPYLANHIASAFDAFISLCSSQESRDRFLLLTGLPHPKDNDSDDSGEKDVKIINTNVLGFSDMGVLKSLALYNDLDNPLFENHPKFNINEFMDGCGWSLQKFHMTRYGIYRNLMTHTEECRDHFLSDKDISDSELKEKTEYDFLGIAAKNPESLEHDFVCMTTPEQRNLIQQEALRDVQLGMLVRNESKLSKLIPIKNEMEVVNVAIISARIKDIYPPAPSDQMQKSENDPDAPLEDDSLLPHRHDSESNAQVVAQLEVLHELRQSFEVDGKQVDQTHMLVGRFETCLNGDPNGDDMRWRLAAYRPALEFM